MNKTVQLVNEWAAFEATHPDADLAGFCRDYLNRHKMQQPVAPAFGGAGTPPTLPSFLAKLIGYIASVTGVYFHKAFVEIPEIRQKEDFYFLSNIAQKGECRKTEVIYEQLLGLTTGIDVINRLLAGGLISERSDPSDKRAKLLRITDAGNAVLQQCYKLSGRVTRIVFHDLEAEDLQLCIQLLRGVEARHAALLPEVKDLNIYEIEDLLNGKLNNKRMETMNKKHLAQVYKDRERHIGVFQIRNTVNGKIFIDSSVNLDKIWNRHHFELNFGSHRNTVLQKEWNDMGAQAFVFEILREIEPLDTEEANKKAVKQLEQELMAELQPYGDKGYH